MRGVLGYKSYSENPDNYKNFTAKSDTTSLQKGFTKCSFNSQKNLTEKYGVGTADTAPENSAATNFLHRTTVLTLPGPQKEFSGHVEATNGQGIADGKLSWDCMSHAKPIANSLSSHKYALIVIKSQ